MEEMLSHIVFDHIGTIGIFILITTLLIQIFFYLRYYSQPVSLDDKDRNTDPLVFETLPSVSVIIISKDNSLNLEKNLPSILSQQYPNFEVIVVNDGSSDDTEFILKKLQINHSNLYHTFAPSSHHYNNQKQRIISLTIGIKAASKDLLLFTEPDSCPDSPHWIQAMAQSLPDQKDILLGYCRYNTPDSFWGKTAAFDNTLSTLQYMSRALKHKPYIGTYKNIAYRRSLFFENKGFSSVLNYESAEEIFLNYIMNESNTEVILSKDSFVECHVMEFSKWRSIKTDFFRAKKHFIHFSPHIFNIETITRYCFYITFTFMVVYSCSNKLWAYLVGTFFVLLLKIFFQNKLFNKISSHLHTKKIGLFIPALETILPFYNLIFRIQASRKKRR